jgi:tryptophan synthase beta chain
MIITNELISNVPDQFGMFGKFGGQFASEILLPALNELEDAYNTLKNNKEFENELNYLNSNYLGRKTPLYHAKRLSEFAGGAKIFLKREDLLHGGAHKGNNVLGQALIAKYLGKNRIIAETGAGQHGTAVAMIGALFNLETDIYMGEIDIKRQNPNVQRMKLMGANVIPVKSGSATLKDAVNEAMRDWISSIETSHYLIGSVVGPHPFPMIVRDFQSVIGKELLSQCLEITGRNPDMVIACAGGGSNAAGTFHPLVDIETISLIGVEAGGKSNKIGENCQSISSGSKGVLHGSLSYILQNQDGQIENTHSISAGLDYPGIGPEHAYWHDIGRVTYTSCSDEDSVKAFKLLSTLEGIIPALESSHAISIAIKEARQMDKNEIIIITLSGRGDKDIPILFQGGHL